VTTVSGGRVPAGCTDSTVPGGCADVGTHTRRGRRPSRRSSASTTPACWPASRALLARTIGGGGGAEVRGGGAPGEPTRPPAPPGCDQRGRDGERGDARFPPPAPVLRRPAEVGLACLRCLGAGAGQRGGRGSSRTEVRRGG